MAATEDVESLTPVNEPSSSAVVINVTPAVSDPKKDKDSEEDKDEKPALPPVSVSTLFQYATRNEYILIACGLTAALIAGLCMPAMVILFGRLTNAFVYADLDYDNIEQIIYLRSNGTQNVTDQDIKDYLGIGDFNTDIKIFGYGVTLIGVIQFIMGYIFVTSLNYAAEGQVYRLRGLFLRSILRQEIGWFDTHETNDFASRVTEDLNKVQDGIGEKIGMFVFFFTTFFFSMINAFIHGWELTLVILSVFPVMVICMGLLAKLSANFTANELKKYANAGSIAEEALSSIRTVFSFGGERKEMKSYEKHLQDAKTAGIKRGAMTGFGMGMMWFIIYAAYALAFWYGTKLIVESRPPAGNNEFDPADLIIVFFSVLMGAMNMGQAAPYIEAFNTARGAAAAIYDVIERKSDIDPTSTEGKRPQRVDGTFAFHQVHFQYPSRPDVKVLKGIDIEITPGETVALVGSSGCGKSTCIQLLQRFYDPSDGKICLDGTDIKELNLGWLRDQIGIVGQEPVLFATSILENIRYGRERATIEEIEKAAKEANAHDFIMKLPEQYNTNVGERGIQMSGGQKQRIAIARALIKRPKVLLLDEATSALDNQSEAIVQKALDEVSKGRTTLIIAHRLSTVKNADKIIVLNEGKIVEIGTHDELMEKREHYFDLVKAQLRPEQENTQSEVISSDTNGVISNSEEDLLDEIINDISQKAPMPISRQTSIRYSAKSRRSSARSSSAQSFSKKKSRAGPLSKLKNAFKDKNQDEEIEAAPPVPMTEILKWNKPEWFYIVGGVICAALQGCLMPAFAILFGEVLGTLSTKDPDEFRKEANKYSMYFVLVGVCAAFIMFFQTFFFALSGEKLTLRLRLRSFESMLHQEMGWFDMETNSVGALCSRLSQDASAVQGATGTRVGTIVQSVTTLTFCIVLALVYSAKLGAVMIPFIPFILVSVYLQAKIITGQSITETDVMEKAAKLAIEAISNIRTVASLHKEELFSTLYSEALYPPHVYAQKASHIRGLAFGFAQSVIFFAYAAVMFYGGHLIETGEMEYEDVFKVAEALILGTMMVGQAMAFAPNFNKAKVSAARLAVLFERKPLIDSASQAGLRLPSEIESVKLKNVLFHYPTRPKQQILKGMNVDLDKGETIALVGSSGCGKSTIINLLERFYDSTGGEVTINGKDIQSLNVGFVRSLLGLVSQEPVLFDRTIGENIAYGDNERLIPHAEIEKVSKQANIHDFIHQLPEGYKTRVGAKGTQLSGGQKQRIAIARALVRNPQILLLDEATSALDAESELVVQEALDKAQKGRTSIIIAHRLSTVRNADKILVIQSGKVVEEGSHDELFAKRGEYFNLYQTNIS